MMTAHAQPVKQRRTLWSAEELAAMKDPAFKPGKYGAVDAEVMWRLLPSTTLKRAHSVNYKKGCPVHGQNRRRYSWTLDPINHPGQVRCAKGGEWYPPDPKRSAERWGIRKR